MRVMKKDDVMDMLLQSKLKFDAERITYKDETLDKYLDSLLSIAKLLEGATVDATEIKDDCTSETSTWSSQKIHDEILELKRKINNLIIEDGTNKIPDRKVAELRDIRLDVNGVSHTSAGDAIRDQFKEIKKEMDGFATKEQVKSINVIDETSSTISNGAILGKSYRTNGNNSNIITVPSVEGYVITAAINKNYEGNKFFAIGVSQGKGESYVFTNRVIGEKEPVELYVKYTKVS